MGQRGDFNYKEKIDVISLTEVEDGYGGYTTTEEVVDTFYATVSKLIYDFRDQRHLYYIDKGISFHSIHRIQVGENIRVKVNDVYYKIVKNVVQRRKFVYICEEVI